MDRQSTIDVIKKVTQKYIKDNPPKPLTFKPFNAAGILRDEKYFFDFNFDKIFPNAKKNEKVYAWAKYYSKSDESLKLSIYCQSPVVVYSGGEVVFKSDIFSERYSDKKTDFTLPLKAGENDIVLKFTKTPAGFGGKLGPFLGKNNLPFYMPGRINQEGFIYTSPLNTDFDIKKLNETNTVWFPEREFPKNGKFQMENMYGLLDNAYGIAYTSGEFFENRSNAGINHKGKIKVLIDGKTVYEKNDSGVETFTISEGAGKKEILIYSYSSPDGWGFEISFDSAKLESPVCGEDFCYLGPFSINDEIDINTAKSFLYPVEGAFGKTYWRLARPNTYVRPYNGSPLFGTWGYPVGVTLYGMLKSAKYLGDSETLDYIKKHVQILCDTFQYALYDKEKYKSTTSLHHLLTSLDSLDDCGAFASLMLEAAFLLNIKNYEKIADFVAHYIFTKQRRLDDGTFFRKNLLHHFHENTMWIDDLYMSVPFLARYSKLTHDDKYILDGAKQFLGYKKRLFMEDKKLFSHVLDLNKGIPTQIPWGRGNGWVAFSLTEILYYLDKKYPVREELLKLLNELLSGVLEVQGKDGMWHQVLDEHDSYAETSSTAMFICALSRSFRHGWLFGFDEERVISAIKKAWYTLSSTQIDDEGNVYGVCRGSEFSYSSDYYKYDLLPKVNDPHGVGIVLMAGYEYLKLCDFLESRGKA